MFLTISANRGPGLEVATDLGYLLHKHPDRVAGFTVSVGQAHVLFPEATAERCTVALFLDVDPIGLVRNKRLGGGDAFALGQYVNDRPYAASSMVAAALGKVFATARAGRCESRPELAATPIPLEITIPALPCRGGAGLAVSLFEPLGWTVDATSVPLDPEYPEWGHSRYVSLRLVGTLRLADALNHLYVLLPVLDDAKHYWVSGDEVDKLIRAGGGWLADHPARDHIMARYLAHQRAYVQDATERLLALDDDEAAVRGDACGIGTTSASGAVGASEPPGADGLTGENAANSVQSAPDSPTPTLQELRLDAVQAALADSGVHTVVDIGCGEGALLRRLAANRSITRILGTDVSAAGLERAADRLHLRDASTAQRERIQLIQSSVTYTDPRIAGFDGAVLAEVIEHIDESRLPAAERVVFGHAHPRAVVVTTPNAEYNVNYPNLAPGTFRHTDHRFEWTRAQFAAWAHRVAGTYGYTVEFRDVGEPDEAVGPPTQLALFTALPPISAPATPTSVGAAKAAHLPEVRR